MTHYNMSAFNDTAINLSTYLIEANKFSNDWFGILAVVSFWMMLFISLKSFSNKEAAAAATGLTMLFALFGRAMGLIDDFIIILFIILSVLVGVYLYLKRNQ